MLRSCRTPRRAGLFWERRPDSATQRGAREPHLPRPRQARPATTRGCGCAGSARHHFGWPRLGTLLGSSACCAVCLVNGGARRSSDCRHCRAARQGRLRCGHGQGWPRASAASERNRRAAPPPARPPGPAPRRPLGSARSPRRVQCRQTPYPAPRIYHIRTPHIRGSVRY